MITRRDQISVEGFNVHRMPWYIIDNENAISTEVYNLKWREIGWYSRKYNIKRVMIFDLEFFFSEVDDAEGINATIYVTVTLFRCCCCE